MMTTNGTPWWFKSLDRFGTPMIILMCIGLGIVRIAGWIGPKLDTVFQAHVEQMESLTKNQSRQTDLLVQLAILLDKANQQGYQEIQVTEKIMEILQQNQVLIEEVLEQGKQQEYTQP